MLILLCAGLISIILVTQRSVSTAAAAALVSRATNNSGDPSTNGTAGLTILPLAVGNVRRVERQAGNGAVGSEVARPSPVFGSNGRSGHERVVLATMQRRCPNDSAGVAKERIHLFQADTTGLGVDEVYCVGVLAFKVQDGYEEDNLPTMKLTAQKKACTRYNRHLIHSWSRGVISPTSQLNAQLVAVDKLAPLERMLRGKISGG